MVGRRPAAVKSRHHVPASAQVGALFSRRHNFLTITELPIGLSFCFHPDIVVESINRTASTKMFAARQVARNAPRFAAQMRAPAQRRLASSATENAFVKERQHIKDHAKGTTGTSPAATN